jgi:hypothetical protein
VQAPVARITKCNQILFCVIPKRASRSNVVNLEILQRPTPLAAPTVPLQDSLAECCVHLRIESEPRASLPSKNRRILLSPENFRFVLDTVANCESNNDR